MRKAEVHVTTKTGQNKASPIERNTPIAQNSVLCSVYFAPAESRHLRKSASDRCSFSLVPMAFPYPFCFPFTVAARKWIQKTHMRPAAFCTNHLASCFDDSAKGAAAFSARKRTHARNHSPKVVLAGKLMTAMQNTN